MVTDQVGIGLGYVGRDGVAFRGRLPFGATMISARSALVAFVIASWHTRGDRIALCVDGRGPWVLGSQAGLRERSRRCPFRNPQIRRARYRRGRLAEIRRLRWYPCTADFRLSAIEG